MSTTVHNKIATFNISLAVGEHTREELEGFVLDSLKKDGWDVQCVSLIDVNPKPAPGASNEHYGPYPIDTHADGSPYASRTIYPPMREKEERSIITGNVINKNYSPIKWYWNH